MLLGWLLAPGPAPTAGLAHVADSAQAVSDVLGGVLLDDTAVVALNDRVGITLYQAHERTAPANALAERLAAHYGLAAPGADVGFRGPVSVLGLDLATGSETGVPEDVIESGTPAAGAGVGSASAPRSSAGMARVAVLVACAGPGIRATPTRTGTGGPGRLWPGRQVCAGTRPGGTTSRPSNQEATCSGARRMNGAATVVYRSAARRVASARRAANASERSGRSEVVDRSATWDTAR
jgi:hypothetical protein